MIDSVRNYLVYAAVIVFFLLILTSSVQSQTVRDTIDDTDGDLVNQYELTIIHEGAGSGTTTPSEGSTLYESGSTVDVFADPDRESEFIGFGGDCSGTSCTVTMDQDRTVSANFGQSPTADFDFSPVNPVVGEEVTFDGSSSSDPNNQDLTFSWNDETGTIFQDEPVVSKSYSISGTYTMTLTVGNEDGLTDTHQQDFTVEEDFDPAFFEVSPVEGSSFWNPDGVETIDESSVRVEVENTGDEEDTQEIVYDAGFGGTFTTVTLDGGESSTETLTVFPEEGDAGEYTGTVESDNDSFNLNLDILEAPEFTVTSVEASDIVEGDTLEVDAAIVNAGEVEGTQTVSMSSGVGDDETEITLSPDQITEETFTTSTSIGDSGSYTASVTTEDDEQSDNFTVQPIEYALDVSHLGDGSGNTNPSEGTTFYESGTTVEVTASADSGSEFVGFGSDCSGTSCTVTMNQDRDVTAQFDELDPAEFEVSSVNADSTVTEGNSYSVSATVENIGQQSGSTSVSASSDVGSDSASTGTLNPGSSTSVSFSIGTGVGDASQTVTTTVDSGDDSGSDSTSIVFREYDIVCSTSGSGSTFGDCGSSVERTGTFSPTASASDGWEFDSWSGGYSSTSTSPTFTADDSSATGDEIQLTANFNELDPAFFEVTPTTRSTFWEPDGREDQDESSVRLGVENTGEQRACQDIVYDTGFGTDSTQRCLDPGEYTGDFGPTLDVMPSIGDAGSYTGTVSSDDDSFDVNINVGLKQYDVNCDINGQGSVGSDCGTNVERTDSVIVSADPDEGWAFAQWSGDTLSTSSSTTVTSSVSNDIDVTANFVELGVDVSVSDRTYSEPQEDLIQVIVENTGDIEDTYDFAGEEVDNPNNWDATLPNSQVELSPTETTGIPFSIEVPEVADDGDSLTLEFEAVSTTDSSISDTDTFIATVEFNSDFGLEIVDIDPDPVTEGENFDIMVDIENRAPFEDDTFLTVDSVVDGQNSRTVTLNPSSSSIETFSFSTVESDGGQSYTAEADETSSGSSDQQSFFVEVASILVCESTDAQEGNMWVFDESFRFSDGIEECYLDGADIVTTNSGGSPGNIWIDGANIHWVDQSGVERAYEGPSVGSASGSEGSMWVDGDLYYVDQNGDIRVVDGT